MLPKELSHVTCCFHGAMVLPASSERNPGASSVRTRRVARRRGGLDLGACALDRQLDPPGLVDLHDRERSVPWSQSSQDHCHVVGLVYLSLFLLCVCVCVSHLGGGTKVWCVLRVCWVIHRGSFGRGVSGFLGFPATEKDPEICSTLVIFGSKNRSRRSINEPLRIVQNPPDGDSAFSES